MRDDDLSLLNQYRMPIMGFAALWILFFHTGVVVLPEGSILYSVYFFIRRIGYLGVDIFFLLSGIGMVYSYEKINNVWVFWGHRARRLVLPMLLMAVLYKFTEPWSLKEFLENISGYHYYGVAIERSFLWFYFAAVTFYLFFPLYYYGFKKAKNKWIYFAIVFGIWLAVSLGTGGIIREDFYKMTNRIPVFLAGVQLGWILSEKKRVRFDKGIWGMLGIVLLLGLFLEYLIDIMGYHFFLPYFDCGIPAWMVSIPMTFFCGKIFSWIDQRWSKAGAAMLKVIGFFGMISYEFYCVQEWIFDLLVEKLLSPGKIGVSCLDLLVFILTTAFGWLLYRINKNFWKVCQYIFSKKV